MTANRNDGYYPQDPDGGNWLQRLVRWAFECRHDWTITGANGFGLPSEAQCLKCGMHRHRILKADDLPKVAEWEMGQHPKHSSANRSGVSRKAGFYLKQAQRKEVRSE
jgi:hypothetical protein